MQKAGYRIRFVSGELAGRTFLVPQDGILIGRSRSADIRPGDEGIDIRHAALRCDEDGGLVIQSLCETVFVQKNQLEPGAECALEPGADVLLGDKLSFVVEKDDFTGDIPAPSGSSDDDETVDETADETADDTAEASGADGAGRTRYASDVELTYLRTFIRRKVRRRRFVLTMGVLLILFIIGGGYIYSELRQEDPVTWPGEVSGVFNDDEFRIHLPPDGKFLMYYPKCGSTVVRRDGDNCEVLTLLGKNLEVPFHLQLTVNTLPDGFCVTGKSSFQRWYRDAAEKEGFSFLSAPESLFFAMDSSSGYPYRKLSYRRSAMNSLWQGIACYLRYGDREIIFLREVPFQHFWRAENVVSSFSCFVVSPDAVKSYWEIPERIPDDASAAELYKQLMNQMSENAAVSDWAVMKSRFALLLSISCNGNDEGMKRDAFALWRQFRERQQLWYSRACLAYQQCQVNNDLEGMRRILNECLRKFPEPDDYRYTKINRNIWTIDL